MAAGGGLTITAGHNDIQWNALTFIGSDGASLNPFQGQEVLDHYHLGNFEKAATDDLGRLTTPPESAFIEPYFEELQACVDAAAIRAARFKVVIDACAGAAAPYLERFAEALGFARPGPDTKALEREWRHAVDGHKKRSPEAIKSSVRVYHITQKVKRMPTDPARVRLVQHADRGNHGTGASRNLGLSVARGEFVTFLDADDAYLPKRLEIHVALLDRHPEAVMVQSCVEYWHSWLGGNRGRRADVRESAPPLPIDAPVDPPHLLVLMLRSKGHAVPAICSLTIRLDAVRRLGGFDAAFRHAYEDQVLLAKLYLMGSTLVIADVLARYRQHSQSLVHRLEREGIYVPGWPNPAHRAFVEWLQGYVAAQGVEDRSLHAALSEELWPYHHAWAWRMRNFPALFMRGVRRLAQRIGFSDTDNVEVIERDLMALFPRETWGDVTDVLIAHGRATCDARKPLCTECVISRECRWYREEVAGKNT